MLQNFLAIILNYFFKKFILFSILLIYSVNGIE